MLLDLFLLFVSARLAGELFARLRQPAVVGEILVGLLIGPSLLGLVRETEFLSLFAELGVVFLLFIVGLETNPRELWRVGRHSAAVAVLGVVAPFALGYFLMQALHHPTNEALFVGAALTATSVGITARVLSDVGKLGTVVARVILGAAVFDDILGILVLAVISAVATEGGVSLPAIALLAAEAIAFCVLAVLIGRPAVHRLSPRFWRHPQEARRNPIFALAVALCLGFSLLATTIKLAAIVGAFFAGILFAETREAAELRRSMDPIYAFFVPIFFVIVGTHVALTTFTPTVLLIGLLITLIAVLSKLLGCGLGALPLGRRQALTIGIGMVPRGEVGLVVASLGLTRGIISQDLYSMVVMMCVITSILAPPLLRPLLRPAQLPAAPSAEGRP